MTIKTILPAALVLGLGLAGVAHAQNAATTPAAPVVSGPASATNNAVNTAPANNSASPVPGANSFTEGQARERIQAKGYSQITNLALDNMGVWRGKGTKSGQTVDVSMDYQGNVIPQ